MVKKYLLLLPLFLSLLSLVAFSQTTEIGFNVTIVYASPQSISNHVYYLNLTEKGETIVNGTSIKTNITSISGYIGALNLSPLPLNGVPLSPPTAIEDNIYFIYVPNVTSLSNLTIKKTYLAYANYTNGSWHLNNVITNGIVTGISSYNNSIYALWKPSLTGEIYLLKISKGKVVNNVTLGVKNVTSIEVGNGVGIVSNVSSFSSIIKLSSSSLVKVNYYVINISTGKVLYEIPDYNGISPTLVSTSGNLALVTYLTPTVSFSQTYLVLYNLTTGNILSEKTFEGIAFGYINDKFILVEEELGETTGSAIESISIYNLSWGQIYHQTESITPYSLIQADGLYVNSSSLIIILTLSSSVFQNNQVVTTTTLKLVTALQAPRQFAIHVTQQHYPGYTILNISWNENPQTSYLVYVNDSLIAKTTNNYVIYNVSENGTYLIKIVAENPLGELEENATVQVTVQPAVTTTTTTTTSTSTTPISSTTITTSSTPTTTTSSSSTITSTTTTTIKTTSSSMSTFITATSSMIQIVAIVAIIVIIIVIALAIFLLRRK